MKPEPIRSARPLGMSFATSAAVQGLTVASGIVLARVLGPAGRGELALVLLWPTILAAVGSLGMADATTYLAAQASDRLRSLVGSSLVIGLVQSGILVGLGIAAVHLVHSDSSADTRKAAYIALGYIPLYLTALYLMNILNGLHRFGTFQALRLLVYGGMTILVLTLTAVHKLTVESAAISYLVAHAVVGIASGVLVVAVSGTRVRVDGDVIRSLLSFGLRSHVSSVSALLNERLDQLLISVLLAPVKLGLYVVAVTLTSLTNLIGTSTSLITLPAIARLHPGKEQALAARQFISLTVIVSAVMTLPIVLLTEPLIGLFFGSAFTPVANVCRVLLVASIFFSTNRCVGAVLKAVGRPLEAGVAEILAIAVTLVGLAVLLPSMGLMGAAIASLVSYGVSTAWMTRRAARALEVGWVSLVFPTWESVRRLAQPGKTQMLSSEGTR